MPPPTKVVRTVVVKPAMPAAIQPIDISYVVMTAETAEDDFQKNDAYMCVSWTDYLVQAQWEQDKLRYIKQLRENIKYYEELIKKLEQEEP